MHKLIVMALATLILAVGCDKKDVSSKGTLGVASVSATGLKEYAGNEISVEGVPTRCEDMFSMGYAILTLVAPPGVTGTAEVQCGGETIPGATCPVTAPGTCTAVGDLTTRRGVFGCKFTTPSGATRVANCLFDL